MSSARFFDPSANKMNERVTDKNLTLHGKSNDEAMGSILPKNVSLKNVFIDDNTGQDILLRAAG